MVKTEEILELDRPGFSGIEEFPFVKTRPNMCVCCLSKNVPFVKLSNCKHVEYFDCNFKFKLEYPETLVCYACHGMLKDIYQFKRLVETSVTQLTKQCNQYDRHQPNLTKLSKLEQSDIEILHTLNSAPIEKAIIKPCNPKFEIKIEIDDISNSDPENEIPLSEIKTIKEKKEAKHRKRPSQPRQRFNNGAPSLLSKYEGKIKCVLLDESEMQEDRRKEAAKDKFKKLLYRCEDCIVGYDHELTLKEHMEKRHSEVKGGHKCVICKSVLSSLGSFKEHMRRHYRRIECVACGTRYSSILSALNHYSRMHSAIETYKCPECEFTSTSYRRYRYHRGCHKQKVHCSICGSSFVNNSGLKVHMYTVHQVSDRVYTCGKCPKTYRTRSGLLAHTTSAHVSRGAYCVPCRTHFRTEHSLKHHLLTHSKHTVAADKKHVCVVCDARFMTKGKLSEHVDWEHLKNTKHKCAECNKAFMTNSRLRKHIKYVHEKRRPPRNKMCDFCGRGFTTMAILRAHIRTHTGERPHACARCAAAFAHPAALYTHNKLLHSADRKQC